MSVVSVGFGNENDLIQIEKVCDLKGDDIQKLSVIQTLPQLLQSEPSATHSRIIPKIIQDLPNSSCEFHIVTSKVFLILMEKSVSANLMHAVLQGIASKDVIVSNCWMETLLGVIGALNKPQIKNEIIPLAVQKSMLIQPVNSRIASCKIVGKLATHKFLDQNDVKRDLLPLAQSLCQDCHSEVRKEMCIQLPFVAQGLGNSFLKSNLMVSLVELATDESSAVRSEAISATVHILPLTNDEIKKGTILPLVKQFCEKSSKTDDNITSIMLAKEIGKLVEGLQYILSNNEIMWFMHYYKTLSKRGITDRGFHQSADIPSEIVCRQFCAQSLPLMAMFTFSRLPSNRDYIYTIIKDLSNDSCYLVRRSVAKCFNELLIIFGAENSVLKAELLRLLRDDNEDVLQMLVPNLANILNSFTVSDTLSRQNTSATTTDIGRAMLKCHYELSGGYNWRLLTKYIRELESLPCCMPSDYIHQNFTPIILNSALKGKTKPVRTQAVRTLLIFLRFNGKEMQRRWLRENLINQLCYSKSCYTRNIFVRLCSNALEIFSKRYFKQHFYGSLLDLALDPVANIRLCVASLFCNMKHMIVYPQDKPIGDRLEQIIVKFAQEEKDRDVLEIYYKQISESRRTPANKSELEREERRRQEEEDFVFAGKIIILPDIIPKSAPKVGRGSSASFREGALHTEASQSRGSHVSLMSSDSNFLDQHFYIDAGINFPSPSLLSSDLKALSESSNLDSSVTKENLKANKNITDDEKVTLRKLIKHRNLDKNPKRYSSIISSSCLEENQEKKRINRRSLNLKTKEVSKIPVFNKSSITDNAAAVDNSVTKSSWKRNVKESKINVIGNKQFVGANSSDIKSQVVLESNGAIRRPLKTSNLPVFKRRDAL